MKCVRPLTIKNPKTGLGLEVPCGRCMACRVQRTREWAIRLTHELQNPEYENKALFLTLTYSPENLPSDNGLHKDDVQKFMKRLRKSYGDKKLRYYAVGEYGDDRGRPHYHAIVFGINPDEQTQTNLKKLWTFGFSYCGSVTYQSCRYVAEYCQKKLNGPMAKEAYGDRQEPFALMSQGIGKTFALKASKQICEKLCVTNKGKPAGLPRYYRKVLDIKTDDLVVYAKELQAKAQKFIEARSSNEKTDINKLVDVVNDSSVDNPWLDHKITKTEFVMAQRKQVEANINGKNNIKKKKLH